ncbi:P1 family peptidase [Gordonia sp. (in: high G+C Gram-positive bacteria)]|uniref:P1 family peptidase n=1 Tax=Gordonia sp. (in: high G+C Gram-positive bacteria) TaxID=84139 RepID=UPI00257C9A4F|nr:P1 family peptidase [Gordonia sp. (in: high G+C Gram-positive bacteria)]
MTRSSHAGETLAPAGNRITDVAGIEVGHAYRIDDDAVVASPDDGVEGRGWATGTTVVRIASCAATCAVDVRGGGPGTRETDLLDPVNTVQTAHAIVLSGGSAYGLAAADGVMAGLEESGSGLAMDTAGHVVPIVPAAVVFDLPVGAWDHRPDAAFGRDALSAASVEVAVGSVGAGAGARAGALKGGVGTASIVIEHGPAAGVTVGALMVANPVGAVIDPATGLPWSVTAADAAHHGLVAPVSAEIRRYAELAAKQTVLNTTIGVVATDAAVDSASLKRVAMAGHDGLARAIVPAHSPLDGDTIFAVATGDRRIERVAEVPAGMNPDVAVVAEVSRVAAIVVQRAIVNAVISARSVAGIPSFVEVLPSALS